MDVVILAGGRGTRSADPSLPKIMQELSSGFTLLDQHFKNLLAINPSRVIFALSFGSDQIIEVLLEKYCDRYPFEIIWEIEREPLGTTAAVLSLAKHIDAEEILIILGDTAINTDYEHYYSIWKKSNTNLGIFCHPNLHPRDSDVLEISKKTGVVNFWPKNESRVTSFPLRPITGSYFVKKFLLNPTEGNFGKKDLVRYLISSIPSMSDLLAINTSSYFADTGTSERLQKVREDFQSGAFARRGKLHSGAIFIDRDGCMIPDLSQGRRSILESDFETETLVQIRQANAKGIPVFLVTNQPAIAKGFLSYEDVEHVQFESESILTANGAILDDFMFCPHHPESGFEGEIRELKVICNCRKPKGGMAFELANWHGVDLGKSIVIGDSENDRGLAESIGAKFLLGRHSRAEVGKALRKSIELLSDNF
jgi:histidinol-phosphate phosphatase family protein